MGLAVAFGIDSNSIPFLTEAATYLALMMAGLILCVLSACRYTTDSEYGKEEGVVVPASFEAMHDQLEEGGGASSKEQNATEM